VSLYVGAVPTIDRKAANSAPVRSGGGSCPSAVRARQELPSTSSTMSPAYAGVWPLSPPGVLPPQIPKSTAGIETRETRRPARAEWARKSK
jgi:hypothetical protein